MAIDTSEYNLAFSYEMEAAYNMTQNYYYSPRQLPKRDKNTYFHQDLCINTFISLITGAPKLHVPQMNKCVDKQTSKVHNEILIGNEHETVTGVFNDKDEF